MSFFQRSLKDMISGMRANRQNEAKFIQNTMEDIKKELKHKDLKVKSVAMQKLTYLNMLGFDMTWAAFHVVEVMSTHKIAHKVIGYHAASQSFNENTEVMLLITNLLKKDLQSQSPLEQSIALDCLSNIVTLDLARDLVADVYGLLSASSVPSRKRSALVLYCCFLKYPDALRPCFKGLTEHLDDHDQGVVSSVICVLCELVIQHPHNYLEMAPLFYKLLLTSSNNWMTIKLLKIFGALTPLEPRLTKKLAEPLKNIMASTMAKSLLYECIYTVCSGMTSNEEILHMALEHLKDFVLDSDPNLKYLGFRALEEFVKRVPDSVTQFGNAALQCLSIIDPTIRSSALRVISGLVDKDVVKDVITHMLRHIPSSDTSFRNELSESILTICRRDKYALVPDFSWYLDVLVELARVLGTAHGKEIAFQINDIACRVEAIRDDAVQAVRSLLIDPSIFEAAATRSASRVQNQQANLSAAGDNTVWQVLQAAAWITGEYATFVEHPKETIEGLLQPGVLKLPDFTQSVYIQATLKVFVTVASDLLSHNAEDDDEAGGESGQEAFDKFKMVTELADLILSHLDQYMQNDPEAMERACQLREILNVFKSFNSDNDDGDSDGKSKQQREDEAARFITHLAGIISEDLEPVSSRAQRRIAAPSELSVEGSVLGQFADVEFDKMNAAGMDDESVDNASEFSEDTAVSDGPPGDAASVLTEASSEQKLRSQKHARDQLKQHREKHNVFYLNKPQQQEQQGFTDSPPEQGKSSSFASSEATLNMPVTGVSPSSAATASVGIPLSDLTSTSPAQQPSSVDSIYSKMRRNRKKSSMATGEQTSVPTTSVANVVTVKAAEGEDDVTPNTSPVKPNKHLDVNVFLPLEEEERLPQTKAYPSRELLFHADVASNAGAAMDSGVIVQPSDCGAPPHSSAAMADADEGEKTKKKHRKKRRHKHKTTEGEEPPREPQGEGEAGDAPVHLDEASNVAEAQAEA